MTTIAYKDGVLAADTLSTRYEAREAYSVKILARDGLLAGASGSTIHCKRFRDWFAQGCIGRCPDMGDADGVWGEGVVIRPDGSVVTFGPQGQFFDPKPVGDAAAWGSGRELAIGAMAAGATAEEAIAIASRFDIKTGGEITVLRREA